MAAREALHRLVDALPEPDLPTATRILEALSLSAEPAQRPVEASSLDEGRRSVRILSPRLVDAEQAADFEKEVLEAPGETPLDASV